MGRTWASGIYQVQVPGKYSGDKVPKFRSSWERQLMAWCDITKRVIEWSYEQFKIPYLSSVDRQKHMYTPDLLIRLTCGQCPECQRYESMSAIDRRALMKTSCLVTFVVEVKPEAQLTQPSRNRFKSDKAFRAALLIYTTNMDKKQALLAFCKTKGWVWKAFTEKDLQNGKRNIRVANQAKQLGSDICGDGENCGHEIPGSSDTGGGGDCGLPPEHSGDWV